MRRKSIKFPGHDRRDGSINIGYITGSWECHGRSLGSSDALLKLLSWTASTWSSWSEVNSHSFAELCCKREFCCSSSSSDVFNCSGSYASHVVDYSPCFCVRLQPSSAVMSTTLISSLLNSFVSQRCFFSSLYGSDTKLSDEDSCNNPSKCYLSFINKYTDITSIVGHKIFFSQFQLRPSSWAALF